MNHPKYDPHLNDEIGVEEHKYREYLESQPKMKQADLIELGDQIVVNLGMGAVTKIVDKVKHDDEWVTITLFSSSGKRPQFTVPKTRMIQLANE